MFLIPIPTLKENGGGAVAMAFARSVAASGERVMVVASAFHGDAVTREPVNAGIEFVAVPSIGGGPAGAMLTFFLRAIWLSIRLRPRLVYTHMITTLIPDFSGQRSFMLAQDIEYRFFEGVARSMAKRLFATAIRRPRLLVTSLWLATYFRRRHCDIAFAADVGLSRRLFVDAPIGDAPVRSFDFLLIAKRGAHKRRHEVLAIARVLAQRGHSIRLVDQASDESTPASATGLVVTGAVTAPEMRSLYLRTKVFVGVSRAEGYGLTPLEALSQGCRVVTTPTPSTTNLRIEALTVVSGSDALVERLAGAAHAQLEAGNRAGAAAAGGLAAGSLPFMEDWSAGACKALTRERLS